MTKQETIQRIDEQIMYIANFVIENKNGEFKSGLDAMNALANAKIALCTKYETKK